MKYWQVAVEAPLHNSLTYFSNDLNLSPGDSVSVPLGKRKSQGVVLVEDTSPDSNKTYKAILEKQSELPTLTQEQIKWAEWLSQYYVYPLGEILSLFFPPLKKQGRKPAKNLFKDSLPTLDLTLNNEQNKIFKNIANQSGFSTHLIWGVTGSGKTEIYVELIKKHLSLGKTAMILLPEIALTPQLVQRFRQRLGDTIAVLHSELTDRERTDQWWSLIQGQKQVVIGARSALFCPLPHLGIIIVDEEHESSFKQDEKLKYNARDAAILRGKFENCPVILGSATPSLESWKNAQEQKFQLHILPARAKSGELPAIEVIDMSTNEKSTSHDEAPFWLSPQLLQALTINYQNGKQAALFLNRRGIAQTVLCRGCGFIYKCPNCEISLTLHGRNHLVCHYCDYSQQMQHTCPDCKEGEIKPLGMGTEQIENDLKKLFPSSRILRVDRDEVDSRQKLDDFVIKMQNQEVDFLVGTQMIAKGLDFEKLTLVGIVLADISFNIPDFRAGERSFQLLTQVSGRAGRHEPGKVLIQTYRPDHPSLVYAQNYQTAEFLNEELQYRQSLNYPPYTRMACLRLSGLDQSKVASSAKKIVELLQAIKQQQPNYQVQILGPAPAPLFRLRSKYRYQILLKSVSAKDLHDFCRYIVQKEKTFSGVKIIVDIDPQNLM